MQRVTPRFTASHLKNIRARVSEATGVSINKSMPRNSRVKIAMGIATFLVCIFIATPALAVEVPAGYQILYYLSPETAQFFKPVQKSSLDQGIEVSIEKAYIHGETVEAIVSVCDKTSDRLDDSLDLYDSYDFHTGFDSFGTCNQIGYDAETKTAYFQLSMSSMNPSERIRGSKITFSIQTLLCGEVETLNLPISMDWSTIPSTVKTESADPYDGNVLVPGEPTFQILEEFYLSGMGYIDGKLHIQLYTPGRHQYDDHAFLYMQDAEGNRIDPEMFYRGGYTWGDTQTPRRADFIDYAFDVSQSDVVKYSLFGDFYGAKTRIDGNWSITFPLEIEQ